MSARTVVVIPGDGIGPEVTRATLAVLGMVDCELEFVEAQAGLAALEQDGALLPARTLELIAEHGLALKGPLTTPVGEGFSSVNVALRREFDLYANLRPALSYPGTRARYDHIDILTVRENTEGLYAGLHDELSADGTRAESLAVVTREGADRILHFAYQTARRCQRKRVTVIHKANILKATSGLFLDRSRAVREQYPEIETREMIVDNTCMQLVINPYQFDVIVTTNLFGDILSDLCAGLIGGLGMAPGGNIGESVAIFEAVHGSAPDIAGRGIANPSALILASGMMLEHIGCHDSADRLRRALRDVIESGDRCTPDLGGASRTEEFAQSIVDRLAEP